MKEAGIEIVEFDPIFQLGYLKLSIIVTIENYYCRWKIGFTGGLNVGDEYLGRSKKFPVWRDSHLK